jgi:hypothetical protein
MDAEMVKFLAVGLTGSIGLLGPALGLGLIGYGTVTALGRNPDSHQHDPGGRSYRSRRHLRPDRIDHSGHGGIVVEKGLSKEEPWETKAFRLAYWFLC